MSSAYSGGFLSTAMPFMIIGALFMLLLLFESVRDAIKSSFSRIVEDVTGYESPEQDAVQDDTENPAAASSAVAAPMDATTLQVEREALGLPEGWATPRTRSE